MDKQKLIFVKNLIKKQNDYVTNSNDNYNNIAFSLFANDEFNEVIFELFGARFLGEAKNEFLSDPKGLLLTQLTMMIKKINEEIDKNND
ncbi:MAG: hypothetical protein ABI207_01245 [Crocinitomicaceae bacterium]